MQPLSVLRQLVLTGLLVLGWLLVASYWVKTQWPEDDDAPVDTAHTAAYLVSDGPGIFMYELDRLSRPADRRMIVIGSSSAMLNLRVHHLAEDFPGWDIHNVGIPTSNIQQVHQVVNMVLEVSDEETLERTVFVFVGHYILYAMPESLWKGQTSPLNEELLRYGLYRESGDGHPTPVLGYELAKLTRAIYRVFLGVDRFAKAVEAAEDALEAGKKFPHGEFEAVRKSKYGYSKAPPSRKRQRSENGRRLSQLGTGGRLEDGQFEELASLVADVRRTGARIVLIDGPVPTWNRGPHFEDYQNNHLPFVQSLAEQDGVDHIDLHDYVEDDMFGDSAHLLLQGAWLFEREVARRLRTLPVPVE